MIKKTLIKVKHLFSFMDIQQIKEQKKPKD
jgi:hypothetical protein